MPTNPPRTDRPRRARGRRCALAALLVAFAAVAAPAGAQFVQYAPPGEIRLDAETMEERLEAAIRDAKWRAGRWYLSPWLAVRDVALVDSPSGSGTSRLTASAGAGLRVYRPVGAEWTFAAHILPEWVWQEDVGGDRLNGRYGAGLFGDLGRLGVELAATRRDLAGLFSRELEVEVSQRTDAVELALEFELGGGFELRGRGTVREYESLVEELGSFPDIGAVDRDERIVRATVGFTNRLGLSLAVGVEEAEVDFARPGNPRENSGTSPVVELGLAGRRVRAEIDVAQRELVPDDPSQPIAYDDPTGRGQLLWSPIPPFEVQLFGRRELVYSIDPAYAYFEDSATGAGLRLLSGERLSVRLFAERGSNGYVLLDTAAAPREDDYDAFGAELRLEVGRVTLTVLGVRTDYQSNQTLFDREVTVVRGGIVLGRRGAGTWG